MTTKSNDLSSRNQLMFFLGLRSTNYVGDLMTFILVCQFLLICRIYGISVYGGKVKWDSVGPGAACT